MGKLTYIICGKLYDGLDRELKEDQKILNRRRQDRGCGTGGRAA